MKKGLIHICRNSELTKGSELAKFLLAVIEHPQYSNGLTELNVIWTGDLDEPCLKLLATPEKVTEQLKKENEAFFTIIPDKHLTVLLQRASKINSNFKITFHTYNEYYKEHNLYKTACAQFKESHLTQRYLRDTVQIHVEKFMGQHPEKNRDEVKAACEKYSLDEAETLWLAGMPEFGAHKLLVTHDFKGNPLMDGTLQWVKTYFKQERLEKEILGFELRVADLRSFVQKKVKNMYFSDSEKELKQWFVEPSISFLERLSLPNSNASTPTTTPRSSADSDSNSESPPTSPRDILPESSIKMESFAKSSDIQNIILFQTLAYFLQSQAQLKEEITITASAMQTIVLAIEKKIESLPEKSEQTLLIIDELKKLSENIQSLARRGVTSEANIPMFQNLTFPISSMKEAQTVMFLNGGSKASLNNVNAVEQQNKKTNSILELKKS